MTTRTGERDAAIAVLATANALVTTRTGERDALQTAIDDAATAIGGSGTLAERIATLRTELGGELGVSLYDLMINMKTIVGGSGGLAVRLSNVADAVGGTADTLSRLNAVLNALGGTGTVADRVTTLQDYLRSAPASNAGLDVEAFNNATDVSGTLVELLAVFGQGSGTPGVTITVPAGGYATGDALLSALGTS